jgi:hypothetical protein
MLSQSVSQSVCLLSGDFPTICRVHIGVVMDSRFYPIKFKDRIGLGSDSISIHF